MPTLIGLPSTNGKREAHYARSASEALRRFRAGDTVTAAGDDGAINIWRDDSGVIRVEFQRRLMTLNTETPTLAGLRLWLKVWWPKMGRI